MREDSPKPKIKGSSTKALALFHFAAREVPAYRKFLKSNRLNEKKVRMSRDFSSIPIMDKKNYFEKYPLFELFPNKRMPPVAYASSGSSGKPTFWFRGDKQEERGTKIHEIIFRKIFKIRKDESTLVIICFSMGVWIAGGYTLAACRHIARNGYQLTTVTPGTEKEDIFHIFRQLTPRFKNIVIAGYPPFLMDVVVEVSRRGILPKKNIKLITAGDKFSEKWRVSIARLLHIKDPEYSIISIYGSADAGILGYETPFSIFIRRNAAENGDLRKVLFGEGKDLPAFTQYDPNDIFFEENDGELIFTIETAAPLVRYNIHDVGRLLSYEQVKKILKEHKLDGTAAHYGLHEWRFPFIVKKGRSDIAVTFYALNIYPDNIKAGLENKKIAKLVSGKFFAFNKTLYQDKRQKLYIEVELAPRVSPTKKILALIQNSIIENLTKLNLEYRKLYSILGQAASPVLRLIPFGKKDFQQQRVRGVLTVIGKKPRVLAPIIKR